MLTRLLPRWVAAGLGFAVLISCVLLTFLVLLPLAWLKLLIPHDGFRRWASRPLSHWMTVWGDINRLAYALLFPMRWKFQVNGTLDPQRSYLLISNHASWIDIILLVHFFRRRTPPVCFFLKQELRKVPVIGFACWAMDFPFMKRHGRAALEKNPALREDDLRETRRACERFRTRPVTVVNFAEGTRFTAVKHAEQQSPYKHLLRPKAAGLSFALNAMGDQFAGILDVTLAYRPSTLPVLWSFLRGEQTDLVVHVDVLPVPAALVNGDYPSDAAFRGRFQAWVNELWARKDARLEALT